MQLNIKNHFKKTLIASAVFSCMSTGQVLAEEQQSNQLEEVVVTGIRGSLSKALNLKRDATGVVDAIAAEDIGEFPDLNISESLQRIPGVTITRNLGEGEQVSVRGLAPQFTGVLINGMQAASAAQGDDGNISYGRALTFDLFPSELFSGASVYKTPTASLQDGGLSATVDMSLPRPFDYDGLTFAATTQISENDLVEETQPAGSFLISNTFADGKVGALLQVAYAETILHGELAEGLRFDRATIGGQSLEFARLVRTGVEEYDRERLGLTGTLQFRPSDKLEVTVDAMYGKTDRQRERHTLDGNLFSGAAVAGGIPLNVQNGVVVAGAFPGTARRTENIYNQVDTDFTLFSVNADWEVSDTLSVNGKIGVSDAEFERSEFRITYGASDPGFSYDLSGNPHFPVTNSAINLTDPSLFTLSQVRHDPFFVQDDNFLAEVDFNKSLNGTFTSISGGIQLRNQERAQQDFRQDRNLRNESFLAFSDPARNLATVGSTTLRGLGFDIFDDEGPDGLVRNFAVPNQSAAFAALIDPNFQPVQNFRNSYVVEEDIFAAYLKTEFESELAGLPFSGDFGVRYATTDQSSSSFGTGNVPVNNSRDYDNFLPSVNLKLDLNDDLVLRLSASTGMTRPTLSQINPSQNVQATGRTATINNPDLDPFEADQLDLALEWYFAEESLLGLNFFYKDIDSLVTRITVSEPFFGPNLFDDAGNNVSGEIFSVSRLANGDGAELKGFELSYQQPLGGGFGVLANYTYADSESTVTFGGQTFTAPILGQSKNSYNLIGYYENEKLSARLAYNWRDDFLIIRRGNNENRFQDETGYLDATISYNINDNFKVSFDASNLTSEDSYRFDGTPERNQAFASYGRVYSLRLQYKM